MRLLSGLILLLSCVTVGQSALAAGKPLLQVGSESRTRGEVRPSRALVSAWLAVMDKNDIEQLDECLADQKLRRGDYGSLLRAVKVDGGPGRSLWFVRGALEPYCSALNGAHAFRYFWIEEQRSGPRPRYRLRYQNSGDGFAVYQHKSHGLNDIEATGCIVDRCRNARMSFDGRRYRAVQCSVTFFDAGREVSKPRRCGSDPGQDDQASGFQADPR